MECGLHCMHLSSCQHSTVPPNIQQPSSLKVFIHPGTFLSNCCGVYVRTSVLTFSPCAPLPYYSLLLLLLLLLQPVQVSINLQPGWMGINSQPCRESRSAHAQTEWPASSKWQLLACCTEYDRCFTDPSSSAPTRTQTTSSLKERDLQNL